MIAVRLFLLDACLAIAVAGALVLEATNGVTRPPLWQLTIAAVLVLLLLRRRFPLVTMLAMTTLGLFEPTASFAALFSLYTVAAQRGPKWPTAVAVAANLVLVVVTYRPGDVQAWEVIGFVVALSVVLPLVAGLWMNQRAVLLDALRDRAAHAERERDLLAERAVDEERRRIAREMHDVVAHRVSIVALQAGALSVRARDEETGRMAEVIRESSAAALTELRDILRVLRDDGTEPRSLPTPMLAGVARLAGELTDAGARVETDLPDPLPEVPEQVGRAAYRIVQEALTNAAKHAPGAVIRVRLASDAGELVVEVANALGASAGLPGAGYGVIGMRERVTLAGGVLHAGPDGTDYVVRAAFPLNGSG
ncbi:sensor histidine kinase [Amycolatopsis sp. FDAARGOS 1241]|uniref:sensor histidine kinase n=1 Tax=Amycolatopsis sp. FDAARGOS 1241 TaxID=2778070 RepID=UPI0019504367|nr:histidine kinase [Amycolatopsis sp. FDAARGOS 1241]QRP48046.1 histidine kinase [Amycolatopsis sp. FDAARGOS 1241]